MSYTDDFPGAIKWFREMAPELRETLVVSLERSAPAISLDDLASTVINAAAISREDRRVLGNLLKGVSGLVFLAASNANFRNVVAQAFCGVDPASSESLTSDSREHFLRMLACESSLGITGKAQDVMWGHGRVFRGANVVTQIRPIFSHDVSAPAKDAVLVHDLKIDYREDNAEGSWLVTLDSGRIRELMQVLERALKKEETIRGIGTYNVLRSQG